MSTVSEEQFKMVAESTVLGIAWGTPDGRLITANKTFCRILEKSLDELKGTHFRDFTHPDDLAGEAPLFGKLLRGEIDDYVTEKRYLGKRGNTVWVKVNISAIKNERDELESVIGFVQDVSERKQAEEQLRKTNANLRFVLDNSDTAFILLDTRFRIVTINHLANQWALSEFGRNLDTGELLIEMLPAQHKQLAQTIVENAMKGMPYSYEDKYTRRNGVAGWFHVRFDCIKDEKGAIVGLCIATNETTQYRAAQAEIKSMNESLEKKVKERTTELEVANKELEAFTYSVSHDLMAPLRIIDGFSQVLLDDYRHKLDDEGFQTLQVIKRNATRMGELVNDLLNLARLGRTNLVKRNVDMNDVVSAVIDEMRFSTNKLDAKIRLQDLKPADCDQVLIKQVWANLLSNAIKYSKTREHPQIEIGCMDHLGQIVYYIKDNGVGFDLQYAGKLFGVFQRLHKPTEFPGTGVGLAIVHRIITRHGGKVWADAKVNEGATFFFTLP